VTALNLIGRGNLQNGKYTGRTAERRVQQRSIEDRNTDRVYRRQMLPDFCTEVMMIGNEEEKGGKKGKESQTEPKRRPDNELFQSLRGQDMK